MNRFINIARLVLAVLMIGWSVHALVFDKEPRGFHHAMR